MVSKKLWQDIEQMEKRLTELREAVEKTKKELGK